MATITDPSHFVGGITLPNIDITGPEYSLISDYIDKYEPEYLEKIFGYAMYKDFEQGLIDNTAIYTAIRDGGEYTDIFGRLQKWEGFVSGKNPIANYIYGKYVRDNSVNITGVGATVSVVENGTRVSPHIKLVMAWNEMVKRNNKLHDYLYANQELYPNYVGLIYPPYIYIDSTIMDNQFLFKYSNTLGI